jgi:Uma2 family endonuclease
MPAMSPRTGPRSVELEPRITLHGVSWDQYEAMLGIRGESSGVRLTYLDGELELMSPSRLHEGIKKCIARLLETWALERGIDLDSSGSWTIRAQSKGRGAEPDESYTRGPDHSESRPDLAIEVVWTAGGIDKLEVYRGLGVPEVWFWRQDAGIEIWQLESGRYLRRGGSAILPELDVPQLAWFVTARGHTDAQRRYLRALRG